MGRNPEVIHDEKAFNQYKQKAYDIKASASKKASRYAGYSRGRR
jgi:hypothetical protein